MEKEGWGLHMRDECDRCSGGAARAFESILVWFGVVKRTGGQNKTGHLHA